MFTFEEEDELEVEVLAVLQENSDPPAVEDVPVEPVEELLMLRDPDEVVLAEPMELTELVPGPDDDVAVVVVFDEPDGAPVLLVDRVVIVLPAELECDPALMA